MRLQQHSPMEELALRSVGDTEQAVPRGLRVGLGHIVDRGPHTGMVLDERRCGRRVGGPVALVRRRRNRGVGDRRVGTDDGIGAARDGGHQHDQHDADRSGAAVNDGLCGAV